MSFSAYEKIYAEAFVGGRMKPSMAAAIAGSAQAYADDRRFDVMCALAEDGESWSDILAMHDMTGLVISTEKVHGCNFSFVVEWGTEGTPIVTACRRTGPIAPAEKFYGWREVYERYLSRCLLVATKVRGADMSITRVIIYGELFGAIQPEIIYRQTTDFYVFDVSVHRGEEKVYLGYVEFAALMEEFDYWARPIYIGSLLATRSFPCESFSSTVADRAGVPIEGIVARGAGGAPGTRKKLITPSYSQSKHGAKGTKDDRLTSMRVSAAMSKHWGASRDELKVIIADDIKEEMEDEGCVDPNGVLNMGEMDVLLDGRVD